MLQELLQVLHCSTVASIYLPQSITEGILYSEALNMADKDTVEKFLDNNPEFAKGCYEKKVKADVGLLFQ